MSASFLKCLGSSEASIVQRTDLVVISNQWPGEFTFQKSFTTYPNSYKTIEHKREYSEKILHLNPRENILGYKSII